MNNFKTTIIAIAFLFTGKYSCAQNNEAQDLMATATPTIVSTRIYSQTVSFNLSKGFFLKSAKQEGSSYIQTYKNIDSDTPLQSDIYLFGFQNIGKSDAAISNASELFKQITKSQCVETFALDDVGKMKISTGQTAFVFMAGCGFRKPLEKSDLNKKMSMFVVIQGAEDIYVFQWAESSTSTAMPSTSWPIWRKRLEELMPLSLN